MKTTKIKSARISLYVKEVVKKNINKNISIYSITNSWDPEMVTWMVRSKEPWLVPGGDLGNAITNLSFTNLVAGSWVTFEIPANIVQAWISKSETNNGIILKPEVDAPGQGDNCNKAVFASSKDTNVSLRPKLILNYTGGRVPFPKSKGEKTPAGHK